MLKPDNYYVNINHNLLMEIPSHAKRILEVGCASGYFGAALKKLDPERYVVGIEYVPEVAELAKDNLDEVYSFDIQTNDLPEHFELKSFDCVVFGDVLEHLTEATNVLKKLLPYLKEDSCVVACIPNTQNWTILQQLLTQNFQYHGAGLLDKTHINLMTLPNMFKMFLDAGYYPRVKKTIDNQWDENFFQSLKPALKYLDIHEDHAKFVFRTFQYILVAPVNQDLLHRQIKWSETVAIQPCSLIVAKNNDLQYNNNIAISPDLLDEQNQHQLLSVVHASSIADTLSFGLQHAQHEWIVLAHQDVYLPQNWLKQIQYAWYEAESQLDKPIGIMGVVGISSQEASETSSKFAFTGQVIDRIYTFNSQTPLPMTVDSIDELVLVFRKDRIIPQLSPELGFHFYGTDAVMKVKDAGFEAVVVNVPCLHNSSRFKPNIEDEDLKQKAKIFYQLWEHKLPVQTTIAKFEPGKITFS